jgi:hypothetical protein
MTTTINDVAPIPLTVQNTGTRTPRLFYGTTEIDDELDDIFEQTTRLSSVTIDITNNAGYGVDIQFDAGTPVPLGDGGQTSHTLTMPNPGACNSTHVFVWTGNQLHHDPIIRIKRKTGGVIPTCT